MKQTASLIYRLMVASAIAALVAYAQYGLWQHFNRGAELIGAAQSIKGFAYTGFQRDQSPLAGSYPNAEQIGADMDLLATSADAIRTYSVRDIPAQLTEAGKRDLLVTAGAWISPDEAENKAEVDALIDAAGKMRHVERVIVGNEVLLRGDLELDQLIVHLDRARKALKKPVSTAEPWHVWLKNPELVRHVDYIAVHLLPYHEGVPVESALDYALMRYDELARTFPNKRIVIGEIGWPSRGPVMKSFDGTTEAVASAENQARFIRELLAHPRTARLDYYLMEAIDQPWKVEVEGWAGAYWGLYNADREQKFALDGVVVRDPHWQKKAGTAAVLALLPMLLVAFFLSDWNVFGRIFLAGLIQSCVSTLIIGLNVPVTTTSTSATSSASPC